MAENETDMGQGGSKDPAEQASLAREIGEELTDAFAEYVGGQLSFAELTFLTYGALEDLHTVRQGEYELVDNDDEDEDDPDDGYDIVEATAEQEDLAQEPSREGR